MSIRVLLVEDEPLIRNEVRYLIDKEPDMKVVSEAETGHVALAHVIQYEPDIVVMDINLPGVNGIDTTRMLVKQKPDIKVIALSIHSTRWYVDQIFTAGASGYVVKHSAYEELVKAVRTVMADKPYLGSQIVGRIKEGNGIAIPSERRIHPDRRVYTITGYTPERRSGADRRIAPGQ